MRRHYRLIAFIITMKRCGLIVILLFLPLMLTGCGDLNVFSLSSAQPGDTYYTIQNGTKVPCDASPNGWGCTLPFYYIEDGVTYYCPGDANTPQSATTQCVQATPSAQCTPNWVYDQLVGKGQSWEILSSPQESVNNTTSPEQANFSITIARTVTVTDEKQFTASLGASAKLAIVTITASVRQQVNHSVSQSLTITYSNSITLSIPPKETAYGNYGVSVQITSGHLYDTAKCEGSQSDAGTDVTYVPIAAGWCTWFNNQPDPCPSVSG